MTIYERLLEATNVNDFGYFAWDISFQHIRLEHAL
jgi:hypothetical protein